MSELEELEVLVKSYLDNKDMDVSGFEIENLEAKIELVEKEIDEIISTNPYLYKIVLSDDIEVEQRKQAYKDEIRSYTNYSEQLQEVLDEFEIKEIYS